jgi:putative ABC transport system ATP-binding protein
MDAAISIRGLNHFFGAGPLRKQILFDISADIHPGEIVINTGPSGSGKTTMLTLVCGLRTVQDGSIRTLGVELNGATRESIVGVRRNIGFIFQAHNLIGALTACENVEMGLLDEQLSRQEVRSRSEQMLKAVGLEHRINHFPRELSGGQKQRVAIARALVRRPKIVLADEPTAALDKASGREVVDLLHTLAKQQGCAILLVTHDNRILDIADRILTLEDGRISSFAAGVRANTEQLMAGLGRMHRSGELGRHLRELTEPEFLQVLDGMTTEFAQLLQSLDVANAGATGALLDQVLNVVADRVRDKLSAERTTVFLVDERRGELWSKVAHHEGDGLLDIRLPIGTGIAGKVAQTGAILNIADPYHHPDFNPDVDRRSRFTTRSILAMPVMGRSGAVVGVVQVLNKHGAPTFTTADEQVLREFGKPLGIILETCIRMVRPGSNEVSDPR